MKTHREYVMRTRAATAAATRDRIVEAAFELFLTTPYDQVRLEAIALRAGVSLPTVLRKFHSKEELLLACAKENSGREFAAREVTPGDIPGIAHVLGARYEALGSSWRQLMMLEDRFPAVADTVNEARKGHLEWLGYAFAPHLPRAGRVREARLAALFAMTEIYVWWTWRKWMRLDVQTAERTMADSLAALVASWSRNERRRRRG